MDDKATMKTYVLYHGNCPDGCGAAAAAFLKLGDFSGINGESRPVEYIPVSYGKSPPEIEAGSNCYIVDFSYSRDVLIHLHENVCNLLQVLDHHATAEKDLEGLPFCRFDMNKSGAVLAWEHFHPKHAVPKFILYLQDRDLWQFNLPDSREVSAAVGSYPMDFRIWANWISESVPIEDFTAEGRTCLRLKNQQVENMTKHHRWAYLDTKRKTIRFTEKLEPGGNGDPIVPGHVEIVPVANATVFFSEVGERLLELNPSADCAAYYSDRSDGKRQWGLRSRSGFDCSVIAKAFGGGGHKQASGFVEEP